MLTSIVTILAILIIGFSLVYYTGKFKGKTKAKQEQKDEVFNDLMQTKKTIESRSDDSNNVRYQRVLKHKRD